VRVQVPDELRYSVRSVFYLGSRAVVVVLDEGEKSS
jgi:hypothetical protein